MRCLCLILAVLPLYAGDASAPTVPVKLPPPTPREVAWRILSGVHLSVGKATAHVQPYLVLHLAENTADFSTKLGLLEFHDAYADSRILETTYRAPLQAQIVTAVAPLDIPTSIDFVRGIRLNPAQAFARNHWDRSVDAINAQLLAHSRPNEAIELIKLVSIPGIFPNRAASQLMSALPPGDDRRLGVFGYATTLYRQISFPGFTALLQDHWRSMPHSLVVLAAGAVADDSSHASMEELTQVLPILREVDPARAERLLSDHPEMKGSDAPQKSRKPTPKEQWDTANIERLSAQAETNPKLALLSARSISDPDIRKQLILQIATYAMNHGGDPSLAEVALKELQQLPARNQADLAPQLAELAAAAHKADLAATYVEASFDIAENLLRVDLDNKSDCGVNPAPKDWWPSTAAYRAAIHASVAAFGTGAERFLGKVQEPDLYLLMSVELARALIGRPATATPRLTCEYAASLAN